MEASEHVLNLASPCTTNESSGFKENININNSETPKLCVEPLQMKRKKKGGGYNLRKSLAWDKAFFGEEGVLDPVELSIISGASCSEGLPFINKYTPGSPQLPIKPLDTQKLEKVLFKEMQDEDLGIDGNKDWSSKKIDSSSSNTMTSISLTSYKLPTHIANRSGSKCGDCPRPLPSSSLKRPANVNVGKSSGKDLKLLKVPGLKPSHSPICATTRSTVPRANCVKDNQITKPDFYIQRNPGSKSFSESLQNTQSASKVSSLRPPRYSDGNSILQAISSFKRLSSINVGPVLADDADNLSSKMISDIMIPARPVKSSVAQQESTSFAVPFSRNAHVGGTTVHPSQNQPMKPSGLRMPSPSLSFFSQPKRSAFHDLPLRDKGTDVCGSLKTENLRLKGSLRRTPKIDKKIPVSAISSRKGICSSSEHTASSHVSAVEVIKPNMEQKPMHKIPDITKNRTGRITHEERELQKSDIELPSESGSREQVMDDKFFRKAIEGYQEEVCQPDYHQPHRNETDPLKDSLGETDKRTDKDKNALRTKERASGDLGVSQQNASWYSGSSNIDALEHSRAKVENSSFGSKHLRANLIKETAITEVSTDILTREVHMENAVFASSVGGCRNDTDLISAVDDVSNHSGKDMEPPRNVKSNTSDRLLPEKQLCLRNSQQEKNVEKLIFVVGDRKDGNKVMDTKTASSLSPGKMHDCNFDEDKMTGPLLVSTEFNVVDDSLSSESHSNLLDASINRDFKDNANVLLNNPANKTLSISLCQDTRRTKIDYCSSCPESRTHQGSQENTLGKVTETRAIIQDGSADNRLPSNMALKETESGMDYLRNLPESGNMLNECCVNESKRLTLPVVEFVAENVTHHNHRLYFDNYLPTKCQDDVSHVDNARGSTEGSIAGQTELYLSTSRSTRFYAKETPLRDEKCDDAYGIRGYTADVTVDLSRVEPFSDTTKSEVSEDTNSSFSCLHPKSDHVKVEAAFTPNNKHGDDLNEKSCSSVLPQKAIPFSDEWLAAIEAAGEDILTKKSGAVQNSPPDKSLPEPGPWSPVKRKNNQIGPFDCTKFTNIVPSDLTKS